MGSVHRNGGFGGRKLIIQGYGFKGDIITGGDVLEFGELF